MHASHDIDHQVADHQSLSRVFDHGATDNFTSRFGSVFATARMMTRSLSTIWYCNQIARRSGAFSRACNELFMPVRQSKSTQTISGQNGRKCAAGAPMGLRLCTLPRGGWQQQGLYYVHDPKQPASSG